MKIVHLLKTWDIVHKKKDEECKEAWELCHNADECCHPGNPYEFGPQNIFWKKFFFLKNVSVNRIIFPTEACQLFQENVNFFRLK